MKRFFLAAAVFSSVAAMLISCGGQKAMLYSWEKGRTELPGFSAMTLCYGGSSHRQPYLWTADRLAPMVTYTDSLGSEKWLFDSFLAIEFVDAANNMCYSFGYGRPSSDRKSWQDLIDYWFAEESGFGALDKVVGEAIDRIGAPQHKRTVVMNLPDPMMYQMFNDSTSSSVYWGELDGREMDFRQHEDRIAALRWYVDEVRARWNEASYKNLELMGFYIISEDLAIPGDGWSSELKHYEDVFPAISDYIHSCNEGLYWIPYYSAAPYMKWRDFGIDVAIMQPNYYWGNRQESMEHFVEMIEASGMGMEFEFDVLLEGSSSKAMYYKERFRKYMETARECGIYGTKPIALYSDTDAFYHLAHSEDPSDQELFREFCQFIIDNPMARN